ncbi:hypothetical protein FSP39_023626 [Pinctada imbricata]|uniref:GST C-terminal domain-containing protein n=1 Tax=Pinctada imbricata TaxID=66713 RepID=A0AA88XK19_PINIB|nr:hypothetical protein FSP39_023626 [Pinctada imbricata]
MSSEAGKEVARLRDVFNHLPYDVITYGVLLNPDMSVSGCKIPGSKFANAGTLNKRMANQFAYSQSMMEKHPDLKEAYEAKLKFRAAFKGSSTDIEKVKAAMESCDKLMDDMETLLGKVKEKYGIPDSWLVGPRFSAADVTFTVLLHRLELLGLEERFYPKNKRPHIYDYYQRLLERKSVQQVISEEKKIMSLVIGSKLMKGLPYVAGIVVIGVAAVAAFTIMKRRT